MRLDAICLGYAIPRRDFDAALHSVFTGAANLRLAKNGRLITLLGATDADLPQGVRLDTPPGFSFADLPRGEPFTCRDGILRCEEADLSADLRRARRWRCDLPALAVSMRDPATRNAAQFVLEMIAGRRALEQDAWPAAARAMDAITPRLVAAARRCDSRAAARCAARLVGLGPGLTPAGDDFLVGFLAGLWSAEGASDGRLAFAAGLGRSVARSARRTNDISRTYLLHAARGQVSSRLSDLAGAIGRGEGEDRLRQAATDSLRVGHISGLAATSGLLMGLFARD